MKRAIRAFWLLLAALSPWDAGAQGFDKQIDLVYFCTPKVPDCREWEARDLPQLKASPVFQSIRFTIVPKAANAPIPPATEFPAEIAPFRDAIAGRLAGVGAPMFALVVDGRVVSTWKGTRTPDNIIGLIQSEGHAPK